MTVYDIAKRGYISASHLYRVFPIFTDHTVGQNIRERRLTCSAHELLDTDKRVADIALYYQFQSCENYIRSLRSFKAFFGITPGTYRRTNEIIAFYERPDTDAVMNKFKFKGGISFMEPEIITKRFIMAGLEQPVEMNRDLTAVLEPLRRNIINNIDGIEIKTEPVRMIGIWQPYISGDDPETEQKRCYFAGVEISEVGKLPKGFTVKTLPECTFAVFREKQRGTMTRYAYLQWLPVSGRKLSDEVACDMEIFLDLVHYNDTDECDIYIPIQ